MTSDLSSCAGKLRKVDTISYTMCTISPTTEYSLFLKDDVKFAVHYMTNLRVCAHKMHPDMTQVLKFEKFRLRKFVLTAYISALAGC